MSNRYNMLVEIRKKYTGFGNFNNFSISLKIYLNLETEYKGLMRYTDTS